MNLPYMCLEKWWWSGNVKEILQPCIILQQFKTSYLFPNIITVIIFIAILRDYCCLMCVFGVWCLVCVFVFIFTLFVWNVHSWFMRVALFPRFSFFSAHSKANKKKQNKKEEKGNVTSVKSKLLGSETSNHKQQSGLQVICNLQSAICNWGVIGSWDCWLQIVIANCVLYLPIDYTCSNFATFLKKLRYYLN